MGFVSDVLKFERSKLKDMAGAIAGGYGLQALGGGAATPTTVTPNTQATNPALIDSAMGTEGYGASSAGPGGGTSWMSRMGDYGQGMQQIGSAIQEMQKRPERPLEQDAVQLPGANDWQRSYDTTITSTKTAKRPERSARMHDAVIEAGASGADPISQNGVQTAAIRELTRQIELASERLAKLKQQRGMQ